MITAQFYAEVAECIPPRMLPFMNYGYAGPEENYSWVHAGDECHRYNLGLARLVLKDVPLTGAVVLECGSGRGGNCFYLDQYNEPAAVFGLDLCEPHVRLCAAHYSPGRVGFICGDAGHMPFSSECFDVLLNLESSHCYPDFEAFLAEVRRVLKPGGLLAYADLWGLSQFPYDWGGRQTALEGCGLALLREEDVSEGVYRALKCDDGLSSTVRNSLTEANGDFIEAILRGNEAMRLTLATRQCSYRVMLMRKPLNV